MPLPHSREELSITDRLQRGREMLRQLTGQDFGYDLQAWHDHLKVNRSGGYFYGRNVTLPRIMHDALLNPAWQASVQDLMTQERPADSGPYSV